MSGRMPQSDASEDEDDFLVPESTNTSAVSSRLGSLFSHSGKVDGNASLTYKAPKQPVLKEENSGSDNQKASATDADGAPVRVLHATAAHAFLLKDGQYAPQGKIGIAVLGSRLKKDYKILLYLSNKQPIGQASVTPSLSLNVSANNYVSFVDDRSVSWSLAFEQETQLLEFLKWVLAVQGLLSDDHHKEILSINLEDGEGNPVGEGDSVEIEYTEFIVEDGPAITEFNGTLNSNQKPLRVKLGKGEAPKAHEGWMDGLRGMKKRGKRLFVIPPDLGYSGHDSNPSFPTNTPLMVYAIIKRVKFSSKNRSSDETSRERRLSTGSAVSSNADTSVDAPSRPADPVPKPSTEESGPQKSASESEVHKKADLISRMARIGHAVMGATSTAPPSGSAETRDASPSKQEGQTKPVAPPRPSTLQNPLAIVCADMSLARPIVTQTTAGVTKSSSDGSISPRNRTVVSSANGATVITQPLPQPPHAFEPTMIPPAFPPLSGAAPAMPYMFPFPYPPQSYFLQPPFLPPSLPTSTSGDFSSLASSSATLADKQAILDEIQKCHLHLQDAITKTLVTNLSGVLKKFTDIGESIESKVTRSLSGSNSATAESPANVDLPKEDDAGSLVRVMSKLDQLDTSMRSVTSPDMEPILAKLSELVEQIAKIKEDVGKNQAISVTPAENKGENATVTGHVEALAEKVSSLQAALDKVTAMHAELVAGNEWKEKYEKLKSQALAMKEKYESRIQELEEQQDGGSSDASEQEKIKKIMSAFYKSVSQRFPSGEQFDSDVVRRLILESVNESTLHVLCEETEETSQDQMGDPSSEVSADSTDVQDTTAMEDVSDKQAEAHSDVGGSEDKAPNDDVEHDSN